MLQLHTFTRCRQLACKPHCQVPGSGHALTRLMLQIAKLLIIPFVCLVEKFHLGRKFTPSTVTSIIVVVVGVAIVYAHVSQLVIGGSAPCLHA